MNRIEEIRSSRQITRTALAASVGVSERHIAFIESGKRNPSIKLAFMIAEQLDAKLEDIFLPNKCTNSTFIVFISNRTKFAVNIFQPEASAKSNIIVQSLFGIC